MADGERGGGGPFGFISRRRWLKLSLTAGGVVLAGGAGALTLLRGSAPAVQSLLHLSDHEYQTLEKLVTAVFPPEGPFALDPASMDLPRRFDEFLAGEPEQNVSDLKSALFLLELGPLVYERRWTTFSRLSRHEREQHFERFMRSDDLTRRMLSVAFRKFLNIVFYDHESVWPHIGYAGPSAQGLP